MKKGWHEPSRIVFAFLVLAMTGRGAWAAVARTPEQDSLLLANTLKAIPDEEWRAIAGSRIEEKLEIQKGDTLFGISARLFGDAKYWPKIWALNASSITNPHLIRPGNFVSFLPGSGTELPAVAIQTTGVADAIPHGSSAPQIAEEDSSREPDVADSIRVRRGRSQEWRNLSRQPWEFVEDTTPKTVDRTGLDKRSRVRKGTPEGFELQFFATGDPITPWGEILTSSAEGKLLSLGDTVFVRQVERDLQVGESYAVVGEPGEYVSNLNQREARSYKNLGLVKIVGVKDGRFIGEITQVNEPIVRGALLIPKLKRVESFEPVAGPSPLESEVILDRSFNTFATAQYKQLVLDRGTDDGVREGMVFRIFRYDDPATKDRMIDSDVVAQADLMVVHTSERVSTAIVLRGTELVNDGAIAVLLTDVRDLTSGKRRREIIVENSKETGSEKAEELNRLNQTDVSGSLGRKEAKELRQLERWKENGQALEPAKSQSEKDKSQETPAAETAPTPPVEEVPSAPAVTEVPSAPAAVEVPAQAPSSLAPVEQPASPAEPTPQPMQSASSTSGADGNQSSEEELPPVPQPSGTPDSDAQALDQLLNPPSGE